MAYADYIDASTLQDTCAADTGDTPGKNADCKFIGQTEEATTETANRPHLALAENMDLLKAVLDTGRAIVEIGSLTSFSGSTITINPLATGGADIEFATAGYLYVGNADYPNSQESRDLLFQLTDDSYNEVLVDGDEVYVSGIAPPGAVPGNGFYNAGTVTLTLSATLPTGNYRLSYCRRSTIPEFPDDVLIKANIRGLNEAAGEVGRRSVYVLDASATPDKPADFVGADALQTALTAIHSSGGMCTLFLRNGLYTLPTGADFDVTIPGVAIIGESSDETSGVRIQFEENYSVNFTSTAVGWELRRLNLILNTTPSGSGTEYVYVDAPNFTMHDVNMPEICLRTGSNAKDCNFSQIKCGGYSKGLWVDGSERCKFENVEVLEVVYVLSGSIGIVEVDDSTDIDFTNVNIASTSSLDQTGLEVSGSCERIRFNNCVLGGSGAKHGLYMSVGNDIQFNNCNITSYGQVCNVNVAQARVQFDNCIFECLETSSWVKDGYFARILNTDQPSSVAAPRGAGVTLNNCLFVDSRNQGNDSAADPDAGTLTAPGSEWVVLELQSVSGKNVHFSRNGITYNVEGSPWVRLTNCRIDKLSVTVNSTTTPVLYLTTSGSDGIIEVLNECSIRDLDFGGEYDGGSLNRPIFYVKGEANSGAHPYLRDMLTVVDGMKAWFDGTTAYRTTGPVVLLMDGHCVVRRFVWNLDSRLSTANASDSLVHLGGVHSLFEDFRIHCGTPGDYGLLDMLINVVSSASTGGNVIRGGKIYCVNDW